ncbi:hypothetical protein AWB78_06536 [Caballeronia calidae]|uniref:Uncharacterized protein n=1 Tax=Caballeronia calidae TaxID=1777139 RepID=A0A158E8L9_9BURK|nr:hypothetical protein AWB78_06536 [Caballeronia calidae]
MRCNGHSLAAFADASSALPVRISHMGHVLFELSSTERANALANIGRKRLSKTFSIAQFRSVTVS